MEDRIGSRYDGVLLQAPDKEIMPTSNADASVQANGTLFGMGASIPTWLLIPAALLISELLPIPITYAFHFFDSGQALGGPALKLHGLAFALFVACVFAPLVETAVFQWGCITLLRKLLRAGPWAAIVVSAALFAASHLYSWRYALIIFPVGVVFGYVFVVEKARKGWAFAAVVLLHALRNAISVALIFAT